MEERYTEIAWANLENRCKKCTDCDLSKTRHNVVFGVGNPLSPIYFIGEGPGENEDLQGEPFVGRAGQLLDKMLSAIYLDRKTNLYLTNMVKCRPPKNRDPLPQEQESCAPFLKQQLEMGNPKLVVCLGRVAALQLIGSDFRVTKDHGQWIKKGNIEVMGMYHPAAILRNPSNKPDAFLDFLKLRQKILEVCPEIYEKIKEEPPVPPKEKK